MLIVRSILFALLLPGTVTVLVPYFIVSRGGAVPFDHLHFTRWLSAVPIGIGAGILFRCIRDFAVIGRGTLAPVDPPKHLVARGLYRYVRNPMYVGVLCILCGEAQLFRSISLLYYAGMIFVVHTFSLCSMRNRPCGGSLVSLTMNIAAMCAGGGHAFRMNRRNSVALATRPVGRRKNGE